MKCLVSPPLPQNKKTLVPDFQIETVVTMEQLYEADIRNEHFGLMITAFSNMMSCGLASIFTAGAGKCFPRFKASVVSLGDSDLHCRRRENLVISRTCMLHRLTTRSQTWARSQTWPQETVNNHERVLRCPALFLRRIKLNYTKNM